MIITIDGPAGAGKSTAARALAKRLGFEYLDTGAAYRAVAWKVLKEGVNPSEAAAVARVAKEARIEFVQRGDARRVLCDGVDVTSEIRSPQVTTKVWCVADEPEARRALIEQQRKFAVGRNLVTEGRDQGTEVWPEADLKLYLDASPEARAARRLKDLRQFGVEADPEQVRSEIEERDRADRARPVGRLRRTEDMIVIDNTHLTVEEVVCRMAQEVARRRPGVVHGACSRPEGEE